ncbi:MAG: PD40 domain-containing protein [Planctomycetes bacterium]|nr:PD40 domain-containing protein [Planctomycetota bacterium]
MILHPCLRRRCLLLGAATLLFSLDAGCGLLRKTPSPEPNPLPGGEGQPRLQIYPKQSGLYGDLRQHTFSEIGSDADPAVSPDGAWLYFASNTHGPAYKIYRKPPDSRAVTRLSGEPPEVNDRFPSVNPRDPNLLAFASDRRGNFDIYIAAVSPVEEGAWKGREGFDQAVRVSDGAADEIHPTWSPEGERLAYNAFDPSTGQWTIWIYDARRRESTSLGEGFLPSWDPKQDRLCFQKARRRGDPWYAVWTIDLSGNMLTEVVESTQWAAITPSWAPDGGTILFAAVNKAGVEAPERSNKADDLYLVKADGASLLRLTSHPAGEWSPAWGGDGRIYFCSDLNGNENIWSVKPRAAVLMGGEGH